MSARANPTAIGLFMIGAILLSVIGVGALASGSLFRKQSTFISYFGESVNGLEVGAPVKFQGVPVGQVTNLLIQIELVDKTFEVPVQYDIDLTRLTSAGGTFVQLDDTEVLRQQIADGLRAQLQMESIVTGQLYVELTYREAAAPAALPRAQTVYPEIPTVPSMLAAFGTQAGSLVGDVLAILFRVNEILEEVDMAEINETVVASARAVERLADAPELRVALDEVPRIAEQTTSALIEMERMAERLGGIIDPLQAQLEDTNEEVVLTLQTMRQALEDTRGFLGPDSGIGYQMEGAMASLKDAADALRALVLSMEQNPDMLIRGRAPGG
ncbi:MAG: MlaD family protein [Gemmatimonadota bacterium]